MPDLRVVADSLEASKSWRSLMNGVVLKNVRESSKWLCFVRFPFTVPIYILNFGGEIECQSGECSFVHSPQSKTLRSEFFCQIINLKYL